MWFSFQGPKHCFLLTATFYSSKACNHPLTVLSRPFMSLSWCLGVVEEHGVWCCLHRSSKVIFIDWSAEFIGCLIDWKLRFVFITLINTLNSFIGPLICLFNFCHPFSSVCVLSSRTPFSHSLFATFAVQPIYPSTMFQFPLLWFYSPTMSPTVLYRCRYLRGGLGRTRARVIRNRFATIRFQVRYILFVGSWKTVWRRCLKAIWGLLIHYREPITNRCETFFRFLFLLADSMEWFVLRFLVWK